MHLVHARPLSAASACIRSSLLGTTMVLDSLIIPPAHLSSAPGAAGPIRPDRLEDLEHARDREAGYIHHSGRHELELAQIASRAAQVRGAAEARNAHARNSHFPFARIFDLQARARDTLPAVAAAQCLPIRCA